MQSLKALYWPFLSNVSGRDVALKNVLHIVLSDDVGKSLREKKRIPSGSYYRINYPASKTIILFVL